MHSFSLGVTLAFFAIAYAQSGYNYQQPATLSSSVLSTSQQAGSLRTQTQGYNYQQPSTLSSSVLSTSQQAGSLRTQTQGSSGTLTSVQSYQLPSQSLSSFSQNNQQQVPQQPLNVLSQSLGSAQQRTQTAITAKEVYVYSAPADEEDNAIVQQLQNAPRRKNYRIIFIKAPSQNLRNDAAALKLAQGTSEEKTIIYVLSKRPNVPEVQEQQQQSIEQSHKPEVYFIKYKTSEKPQRAQISQTAIGVTGSSSSLSGSIGLQTNSQQSYQSQSSTSLNQVPSNTYLPPVKK